MAHGRADTIISGITTPNNDDVFSFGAYVPAILEIRVEE